MPSYYRPSKAATGVTHTVFCIHVGAGINEHPHTIRVTTNSCTYQRRASVLPVAAHTKPCANDII